MARKNQMPDDERLFIGMYPAGVVYADRGREEHGDYKRLAFLSYQTLELDIEKDCPQWLAERIREHAGRLQARRGELMGIAQTSVRLGEAPTVAGHLDADGRIVVPCCPFCKQEDKHGGYFGHETPYDTREFKVYGRIERWSGCKKGTYYIDLPPAERDEPAEAKQEEVTT